MSLLCTALGLSGWDVNPESRDLLLAEQLGGKRSTTSCCEVDVVQDVSYMELVSALDAADVLARTQDTGREQKR